MVDTTGDIVAIVELEGDEVTVMPEYYNYIVLINGQESRIYDVDATNSLTGTVTPRYLLPGV